MIFRSQRVCHIDTIVAAAGEHIRPYLTYLSRLSDLIGRTRLYVPSWVWQFYASLWIDPQHRYIHFAFGERDYRLTSKRVREILRLQEQLVRLHEVCYGQTAPPDALMVVMCPLLTWFATASLSPLEKDHVGTPVT